MSDNVVKLKSDDYYRYNAPFRQWLFDSKDKQLSDFKTDEARFVFENEFVPLWNSGRLSRDFYIKGPNMKTNFIRTDNKSDTKRPATSFGFSKQEESRLFAHKVPKSVSNPQQPTYPQPAPIPYDKSYQKRRSEDLEDLVPKKEGHAKMIEDRRIKSAYSRMERNPLDLDISDDQLLSGSISASSKRSLATASDDYETLLRLDKEKKARWEQEIQLRKDEKEREMKEKIDRHNQREREVQEILKKIIKNKK